MTTSSLLMLLASGFFFSPTDTTPEPSQEFLLNQAHEAFYENDNPETAETLYDRAIELETNEESLNARGWYYLDRGANFAEQALKDFDAVLAINPESATANHGRGWALADLERYTESIVAFTTFARLRPESPYGSDGVGWALAGLGDYAAARNAYRRAYQLDPNFGYFIETQAWCSLLLGEDKRAIRYAKEALRVEEMRTDSHHYAYVLIALGYWKLEGAQQAEPVLNMALEQCNNGTWGYTVLRFLAGELSQEAFIQAAEGDGDKLTEAHTYLGILAQFENQPQQVQTHVEWLQKNGTPRVWEFFLAKEWLFENDNTDTISKAEIEQDAS